MALASDTEGELLRQIILAKGGSQPIIDSANHFYKYRIPQILSAYRIDTIDGLVGSFSNPFLVRPTINDLKGDGSSRPGSNFRPLWPYESRRNGLSYMAQLFATLQLYQNINGQLVPLSDQRIDVFLGKVPAILQSEACHLYGLTPEQRYAKGEPERDPGGYAIIKGAEKVLLNIENLRNSDSLLYEEKEKFCVRYTSQSLTDTTVNIIFEDRDDIHVTFSKLGISNNSINVFYIFYVLGLTNNTIQTVFDIMDTFIVDDDPIRQARRRKEMRYYMQTTANTFLSQTSAIQRQIYSVLATKIHDKTIETSPNRDQLIAELIAGELFKNITVNFRDQSTLHASLFTKIRMLAHMVVKYVDFKNGYRNPDDRDAWGNKQLVDVGKHLAKRFSQIWKQMITNIQNKVTSSRLNTALQIKNAINKNYMTEQFINSYNKELWGASTGQREVVIVDTLKRDNLLSAIAHIRRISTPTNRRAKIREKRLIHNTQWGAVCPVMTPEGEACGLVKDTAVTAYVSLDRDESVVRARLDGRLIAGAQLVESPQGPVIQTLEALQMSIQPEFTIVREEDLLGRPVTTPVVYQTREGVVIMTRPYYLLRPSGEYKHALFLNGVHLGYCDALTLREELLRLRRTQQLYFDTGIILNQYKELKIFTNEGRICRPILLVDRDTQQLVIDLKNLRGADLFTLMREGALEYIDIAEQEQVQIYIAETVRHLRMFKENLETTTERYRLLEQDPNTPAPELESARKALQNIQKRTRYTHCEIDPTVILGISAISMPFAEFNPGPRDTYQASMVRQALGGNSTRIELRFDTTMKTILEPGVPTVSTDAHEWLGLDQYPGGRELLIAITTYGGSNQEDALTFNQDAIDYGLFMMMIYHSYKTTISQSKNHQEKIRIPDHPQSQADRYSKLDRETGIVRLGEYVKSGDCLVGKVIIDNATGQAKNDSLYVEVGKEGIVDEVYVTETETARLVRIRLRELRKLQAGDKLASRYSQKGTIGAILPGKDFPIIMSENEHLNGVRPHVIFNPHGIPSRMTMGKLYEILVGKVTAVTGERFNATAFRRFDINEFKNQLADMGFSRSGKEKMINGITGRVMDVEIYTGTVYYQLLRHLVKDKMQARGTGTVQYLTRQPTSGIRKEGGLRLGEMERDALIEYGAAYLTQERMNISSDAYQALVCKDCGIWAISNVQTGEIRCNRCHTGEFRRLIIPYSFKLLTHYLAAANLRLRLRTRDVN